MVGVDRRGWTTVARNGRSPVSGGWLVGRPVARPVAGIARLIGVVVALGVGSAVALANEPVVPASPEEPAAAKAYAVFDQHCARCHQNGKLKGQRAARGFANILDLKASASNPALVMPGNPDGSKLYTMMLSRAMPYDVAHDPKGVEPTASDLTAVRDWVQSLPARPLCPDRKSIQSLDVQGAMLKALSAAGDRARQLRFISFDHLHNACAPAADIKGYAEAASRLINSLSSALEPVTLDAIDDEKTLFGVYLDRIGWDAPRWERLATIYPYGAAPTVQDATGSKAAVMRGDWLAFAATRAPLYYELLGLPDRLPALQSGLQVDVIGDLAAARARRIGIKTSGIARGSRLTQRHLIANGSYWTTSEYAPTPGRADVFDAPIGPAARGTQKPDANLVMFNLPNGFNAFFIANTDGVRVNDLPQSVLRNDASPNHRIGAGLACFTCHENGPKGGTDELRPRLQQDTTLARDVRERLLTMHGTADEHQRLIAEDAERLNRAAVAAGLRPGLQIHGLSPIEALATRYKRAVDAASAAAELGIDAAALATLRDKATGGARDVLDRLHSGLVPRSDFEERFAGLTAAVAGTGAPAGSVAGAVPQVVTTEPSGDLELVLKTDRIAFKTGDLLSVKARVSSNCYLTLISVDRNGRGTVIFPNDFEQNNLIEVGREIQVPSLSAPYQFRLRDKGRETLVGVCGGSQRPADGIKHDFERQRFTELGDYRAFLGRTWTTESEERRGVASRADPKLKRPKGKTAGDSTARYEPQARTAIQIDVK
jgi:mono/diheme cytochrome c family protein